MTKLKFYLEREAFPHIVGYTVSLLGSTSVSRLLNVLYMVDRQSLLEHGKVLVGGDYELDMTYGPISIHAARSLAFVCGDHVCVNFKDEVRLLTIDHDCAYWIAPIHVAMIKKVVDAASRLKDDELKILAAGPIETMGKIDPADFFKEPGANMNTLEYLLEQQPISDFFQRGKESS